jgi:uncharacterized protein (TIGR02099 family)
MPMPEMLRKVLKRVMAGAAVLVIVAAIGVGAFRLVVAQLPAYQSQVQAWARDELGLNFAFARLDARWGLRGPELTFYDASVARGDARDEAMVSARQATIGLSLFTLLTEGRFAVNRLVLDGTRLTLERSMDGELRLQGAPADQLTRPELRLEDLPPVEVVLRDSRISYADRPRGITWAFTDVRLRLSREAERMLLDARATPPADLGNRIDLTLDGSLDRGADADAADWNFFAELRDFNLEVFAALYPDVAGYPTAGFGNLSVWLDLHGSEIGQATVQVQLQGLELEGAEAANPPAAGYERLAFTAEWRRAGSGWDLNLSDLELRRAQRTWPADVSLELHAEHDERGLSALGLASSFLRIEDLAPIVAVLPLSGLAERWEPLQPRGDLSGVELALVREQDGWDYSASAEFERVGFSAAADRPGISGASGTLRADSRSGRLVLATRGAEFDWPRMFRQPLEIDELSGILVWRQGVDGIRLVSDNLTLNNRDMRTRSNLELIYPPDGAVPRLDLKSEFFDFDTMRTSHYLPVGALPAPVVAWLDRAIVSGRVPEAEVAFLGPITDFPFDDGSGEFRASFSVEDGVLAYVDGWPVAEDISGEVEFLNAGLTGRGTGRIMGSEDLRMEGSVDDVRAAVFEVSGEVTARLDEVLAFVRTVPVTARRLGPDLSRLRATAGTGALSLDLTLPLREISAYALDAVLAMNGGALNVDGFDLSASDIRGELRLSENVVSGDGIAATLLGRPVTARVGPAAEPGYRARLDVAGEATAAALTDAFDLPYAEHLTGGAPWQGHLLVPAHTAPGAASVARAPLRIEVTSPLTGAAVELPAPLGKAAGEHVPLTLRFTVLPSNRFDVGGQLGDDRRFALSFWNTDAGLRFRRGSLRFDSAYPLLPPDDGLDIEGALDELSLDEWLSLFRREDSELTIGTILSRVDLDVESLSVLGQRLGAAQLAVRQGRDEWLIEVDSAPVAGHVVVPFALRNRPQVVADMQRLNLTMSETASSDGIEPRDLPGLLINAQDFSVGDRRFGRLSANVQADALGLRLVSLETVGMGFAIEGSGSWLASPQGTTSRLAFSLLGDDVTAALTNLGMDPIVDGDMLEVTASVAWPGGPSAQWQQAIAGDLSLRIEQGSVIDLEPGAGRMMGLLSFSALPRRLSLDFRDVFNRGLVFDEVAGDFVLIDGNAYTDNLLLTGPVADIGVVGRTGLRNEDYQQQAVVTAEPGKVLPTMGFLAGPGVGAALLLFTQIFKEPLKGIGRASYCVTGSWDEPSVERLTPEQLQSGFLCADLPPSATTARDYPGAPTRSR